MNKLFIILILIFITGCHSIKEGKVIEKSYQPSYVVIVYVDKGLFLPKTVPEQWYITISDGNHTDTYSVVQEVYHKIDIGQFIKFE